MDPVSRLNVRVLTRSAALGAAGTVGLVAAHQVGLQDKNEVSGNVLAGMGIVLLGAAGVYGFNKWADTRLLRSHALDMPLESVAQVADNTPAVRLRKVQRQLVATDQELQSINETRASVSRAAISALINAPALEVGRARTLLTILRETVRSIPVTSAEAAKVKATALRDLHPARDSLTRPLNFIDGYIDRAALGRAKSQLQFLNAMEVATATPRAATPASPSLIW